MTTIQRDTEPRAYNLSRNPANLDDALYSASCFAGSADEKCVTVLVAIVGRSEFYRIEYGRVGAFRDNDTGRDWEPVYVVERVGK